MAALEGNFPGDSVQSFPLGEKGDYLRPFYLLLATSLLIWGFGLSLGSDGWVLWRPALYFLFNSFTMFCLNFQFYDWLNYPSRALCYPCSKLILRLEKGRKYIQPYFAIRTLFGLHLACGPVYVASAMPPGSIFPAQLFVAMLALVTDALATGEILKHFNTEYYKFVVARIALVICTAPHLFGPQSLFTHILLAVSIATLFLHRCLPLHTEDVIYAKISVMREYGFRRPLLEGTRYFCSLCRNPMLLLT